MAAKGDGKGKHFVTRTLPNGTDVIDVTLADGTTGHIAVDYFDQASDRNNKKALQSHCTYQPR